MRSENSAIPSRDGCPIQVFQSRPEFWRTTAQTGAHNLHGVSVRQAYDETICVQNEVHNRQRLQARLRKQARDLGLEIIPAKTGTV